MGTGMAARWARHRKRIDTRAEAATFALPHCQRETARAQRAPFTRKPPLCIVNARMNDEQRFLLDLNGYLHLQNVLSPRELAACRASADRHIALCEAVTDGSAPADVVPEGFGNGAAPGKSGGKGYGSGYAWEKPLEQLLFHPKLWRIVRPRLSARSCQRLPAAQ